MRLLGARVKIRQISHVSFETTSQFLFNYLHYSSLSWQITVNFEFMHFLFLIKGPHQSPNLGYFKCSVENLPYSLIIFFKAHVSFSSSFASLFSVMKKKLLRTFLGQTLYTLHKRNQSEWKFWKFRVLRSKFTKFLSVLSSNYASLFSVMRNKSSILFLSEILYTFNKRSISRYDFDEISREQLIV